MTIAIVAFVCWLVAAIPTWIFYALARREAKQVRQMRDEMRRLSMEFSEAVALLQYGALDEAVEMALRWKKRLKEKESAHG